MDSNHPEIPAVEEQPSGLLLWWQQNRKWVTFVLVVLLATVLGWKWRTASARKTLDRNWQQFMDSSSPERMLATADVAQDAGLAGLSNLALLAGADLWTEKAALAKDGAGADSMGKSRAQMLDEAQRTYQRVLDDPEVTLPFKLNAMMGLAAIAENRREWDTARQWYRKVQDQAGDLYPAHRNQAQMRTSQLDSLSKRLVFAPEAAAPPTISPSPPPTGLPDTTGPPGSPVPPADESTRDDVSTKPLDELPAEPPSDGTDPVLGAADERDESADAATDSPDTDATGGP